MADFIAVIRRAVDGLSNNTPEMRAKVYEKARTAVHRQLDNMKPRPAEDMIARQMAKLTEAIELVEGEYGGTHEPAIAEAPAPVPVAEPQVATPPAEPVPAPSQAEETVREEAPAEEPAAIEEPAPEPAEAYQEEEIEEEEAPVSAEGTAEEEPAREPEPDEEAPQIESPATYPASASEEEEPEPEPTVMPTAPQPAAWNSSIDDNPFEEPEDVLAPAPSVRPEPSADEEDEEDRRPASAAEVATGSDVFYFEQDWGKKEKEQARSLWPELDESEQTPASAATPAAAPAQATDDWENFEKIIGFNRKGDDQADVMAAGAAGASSQDDHLTDAIGHLREHSIDDEDGEEAEGGGRSKLIAGALAVLLVLAGVGYAGWYFSDSILSLVGGTSGTGANKETSSGTPAKPATADGAKAPAAQPADTGPEKFTQRLLPDGSETDPGAAGEVANAGNAESTTVADRTPPAPAAGAQQSAPATPPATPEEKPTAQPAADAAAPQTEKMFLYEERLGQASPTAVDGTVAWTVQVDKESGSSQKAVQADIEIPGRKMSVIMTIKRNTDPSLPASHIIELTFSLPKDFEGGGIDSVLRIAMKEREQDQGNPLIAVPAKITDYFHMIALNAYPDAVKTNLELLKSREWIDIPVTYSNGRRALITLQKGPEGDAVFNEVISDWERAASAAAPADVPVPTPEPPAPGTQQSN